MPRNNSVPTFVKWAGGKTQLLDQFKKLFPKEVNGYLEPFVGSGAVFFYIKQKYNLKKVIISDNNEELINAYIVVRDDLEGLIKLLKTHKNRHCKEYYYNIRRIDVNELSDVERAARFLYLNKTCYNGLYRVNSKGKFNVPFGRYKNPNIVNEKNLRKAHKLLQGVTIKLQSFEKVLEDAQGGDFIYFDPPYYPLSKTANFTSYTKNAFLDEEQKKLAEVYRKLDERGCLLMLSNSDTEFIKNLYSYDGLKIHKVKARRAINSKADKRGAINELVILNYENYSLTI